jgi:hypothetical protein
MDDVERELFRAKQRRTAFRRLGTDRAMCLICAEDDPHVLQRGENDHLAGAKYADETAFLCRNCHAKRSVLQREGPRAAPWSAKDPRHRNPLEVIGRWLLCIAEYFELLMVTLNRFGNFLIGLARQGYGSDLSFPERI